MRIVGWIVAAVAALMLVAFSVANRGGVTISFAPLPFTLDVPLFALGLAALAVGLLAGALAKMLAGTPHRRIARERQHRVRALEREIAELRGERDRLRGAGASAARGGRSLPGGPTKDAA